MTVENRHTTSVGGAPEGGRSVQDRGADYFPSGLPYRLNVEGTNFGRFRKVRGTYFIFSEAGSQIQGWI